METHRGEGVSERFGRLIYWWTDPFFGQVLFGFSESLLISVFCKFFRGSSFEA